MQKRHRSAQVSQERDSKVNIQTRSKEDSSPRPLTQDAHPMSNISCRVGDTTCATKHAAVIQRTGLFHPMRHRQKVRSLLRLQRQYGNRFVQRVIAQHVIQTKLQVNQPGDIYEQEADGVADAVMQMPDPPTPKAAAVSGGAQETPIQRIGPGGEENLNRQPVEEEEELQMQPVEEEEEPLQAKGHADQSAEVSSDLETRITSMRGGGQSLPASERTFFEPRFGYDFSQVRVHTDTQAAQTAQALNARAFTVGQDVMFAAGQYAPETAEGKRLMAHELTHVIQQGSA